MRKILVWCGIFTIVGGAAVVGVDLIASLVELATAIVEFFKAI